ncbi:hypothetical protein Tco_0179934, partial [Tanacetum coccineum]
MEGNDDGQDFDKNKLRFKYKKTAKLCQVAVRYAAEPQPLPSAKPKAKPQIMPSAQPWTKVKSESSTVEKKPVKDKKTTKRKKTASPSIGRTLKINEMLRKKKAEIEAKRIAEEEEAAKDKEEEETEDDENIEKEVEKNAVEIANDVTPPNRVPFDLASGGVTLSNISSTKHKERPLR